MPTFPAYAPSPFIELSSAWWQFSSFPPAKQTKTPGPLPQGRFLVATQKYLMVAAPVREQHSPQGLREATPPKGGLVKGAEHSFLKVVLWKGSALLGVLWALGWVWEGSDILCPWGLSQ